MSLLFVLLSPMAMLVQKVHFELWLAGMSPGHCGKIKWTISSVQEKPYMCDHCKTCFADRGTWRNHVRIHTGERPYKCTLCDKSFVQRTNLQAHIKTHTDERPFPCQVFFMGDYAGERVFCLYFCAFHWRPIHVNHLFSSSLCSFHFFFLIFSLFLSFLLSFCLHSYWCIRYHIVYECWYIILRW
jgi:hypothetical protein